MTKKIVIDFLYLDLYVCERCIGVNDVLDEALEECSSILKNQGIKVIVNKVNVNTEELAYKYKFKSSPTIRVNGYDIQSEIRESNCSSCGSLCNSQVDCRVWLYNGVEYDVLPKDLIIEAILDEVYKKRSFIPDQDYLIPDNLQRFYTNMKKSENNNEKSCSCKCC